MPTTNYYQALKIGEHANKEEIRAAYLTQAKLFHSDRQQNHEEKNEERDEAFKLINEAYSVLSDDQKRKHYDENRSKKNGLAFSLSSLPESQGNSSTQLVPTQSYNLLAVVQQSKMTAEELYNTAAKNPALKQALLEDTTITDYLGDSYTQLLKNPNNPAKEQPSSKSKTHKQDKPVETENKSNKPEPKVNAPKKSQFNMWDYLVKHDYDLSLLSLQEAEQLVANKAAIKEIHNTFFRHDFYKLALVDKKIFLSLIDLIPPPNSSVFLREELFLLLKRYTISPDRLPKHYQTEDYTSYLNLRNALQNKEIKEVKLLIKKAKLTFDEIEKLWDLFQNPLTIDEDILADFSHYGWASSTKLCSPEILKIIVHSESLSPIFFTNKLQCAQLSIQHCCIILNSNAKKALSGADLDKLINQYGDAIAQIIEKDPELSLTVSSYQLFNQALKQGFTHLSDKSAGSNSLYHNSDFYFAKGTSYLRPNTRELAADFFYKAAQLGHEEALDALVNLKIPAYHFRIAELYNDSSLSFYKADTALGFYKKTITTSTNETEIKTAITRMSDHINNQLFAPDFNVHSNYLVQYLHSLLNTYPRNHPYHVHISRIFAYLYLAVNEVELGINTLKDIRGAWDEADKQNYIDLCLQAIDIQSAEHDQTLCPKEQALAKLPNLTLECGYYEYLNEITQNPSPKKWAEATGYIQKFAMLGVSCSVLTLQPVLSLAQYLKDPMLLYVLGREEMSRPNSNVYYVRLLWEAASKACSPRDAAPFAAISTQVGKLPLLHCDALVGYPKRLITASGLALNKSVTLSERLLDYPAGTKLTPIHLLAKTHRNQIIESLLRQGINFNVKDPQSAMPILQKNYIKQKRELIKLIDADQLSLYAVAAIKIDAQNNDPLAQQMLTRFKEKGHCSNLLKELEQLERNAFLITNLKATIESIKTNQPLNALNNALISALKKPQHSQEPSPEIKEQQKIIEESVQEIKKEAYFYNGKDKSSLSHFLSYMGAEALRSMSYLWSARFFQKAKSNEPTQGQSHSLTCKA
jgi:curved DNA-binding protein CbpA